jgi:hypothetical protein
LMAKAFLFYLLSDFSKYLSGNELLTTPFKSLSNTTNPVTSGFR